MLSANKNFINITFIDYNRQSTGVKVVKNATRELDREAKRVTKKMPKWTPGQQAGKKVKVRYDLPIKFVNR